ncbi:hypothetical protein [Streptomyces sp. NPDC046909]|uniref:hypothetical protein n=1 Tax=Streptomyces sp. NPDC046909 TaxID=3155617 RepID=UPI0033CC898D
MTSRHGNGRPRLVASTAGRGPAVRGVVHIRLRVFYGSVELPSPTQQYGGVERLSPGTVARVDIGAAQRCSSWTACLLVGALHDCDEVEVVGTDAHGVAETRNALARALNAGVSSAC